MQCEETTLATICRGLVAEVRETVVETGLADERVVHAVRVATKRLRAAWKLVLPLVGPDLARERADSLRELSALLAGHRDTAVLAGLGESLALRYPGTGFEDLVADLDSGVEPGGSSEDFEELRRRVLSLLDGESSAWDAVRFPSFADEQNTLRRVVARTRRRARKRTGGALGSDDPHSWHEWRKAVKRLRYQREFLAALQHRIPGKWDARISRLGSRLGKRNDFANLAREIEARGNDPGMRRAVSLEVRLLMRNCRRLGRRNLARRN